jgi:DNA modification methylase
MGKGEAMARDDLKESGRPFLELLKVKSRGRRATLKATASFPAPSSGRRNDLRPTLELVERALLDLILPARNVRKLEAAHVAEVARAIAELGFNHPVLINESNQVIDGVVRAEAAKRLGIDSVPCIVARHLTASQQRQLRLALNRLQEKGSWDLGELKFVIEELILEEVSLDVTGFTVGEIDQILLDAGPASTEAGPLEPETDQEAVAKLGDIYEMGSHRLICGDARDAGAVKAVMAEEQAQLLLTDEPYNVAIRGNVTKGEHREFAMASGEMSDADFAVFNTAWMQASLTFLTDGGLFATFIDWRGYVTVYAAAVKLGLTPLNLIVWGKTNAGMGSLYRSQHELLPLFKKGKAAHINNVQLGKGGRWRSNLWQYPGASSMGSDARRGLKEHPTVKPTAMLEDALLDLTDRDDVVLDPFLGSGSTLIAAEKTGRGCRGVEIDPRYVDLTIRRWQHLTGRDAILQSTGQTFSEILSRRAESGTDPEVIGEAQVSQPKGVL